MLNYPISFNQPLRREQLTIQDGLIASTDEWRKEFKSNCRTIEDNHKTFPSHTLCKIMDRNVHLLAAIAKNEPFMF